MQKIWQWLRDKKTNTIRKWRSTTIGQRSASTNRMDDPFEDGRFFVPQIGDSTHLLSTHAYDSNRLRPMGNSDSVLQRGANRSKRVIQQLQRRLTPNRRMRAESNGIAKKVTGSSLKASTSNDLDYRRESNNEMRQLLMDEDDSYQSRSSYDYAASGAGGSRTPDDDLSADFLDNFDSSNNNNKYSPCLGRRNKSLTEARRATMASAIQIEPKRGGMSSRWSLTTSSKPPTSPLSAPNSTRVQRRRLRFVIPQVSLTNDDPQASTTLLFGSQDEFEMGDSALLGGGDSPGGNSRTGAYSPLPARRGNSDKDRRMSLAQRRQSNTQLVQSVSGRRASTTLVPLSMPQIHLIRTLWRQVYMSKGPTVIGETVIHRLFFKHPKLKEQFRRCAPPRNFPNHDSFVKFHSKAIGELIDQIVENLDSLDNMTEQLERIGRAHAQVLNGQVSSKLWNLVAETFIDCTLEWGDRRCRSETVRKAWALIIAFMVEKIKHGHLDQRKQMLTMKSTIASLERVAMSGTRS